MPNSEFNLDLKKIAEIILKVFKCMSIAMFLYCLIGLGNSIKKNYPLWLSPLHAEGTIIDYQDTSWQSYDNGSYVAASTMLPVVEFQNTEHVTIKFTDNIGHNLAEYKQVPVIYSKNDANNARIDKGLVNWIDTYIWFFGTGIGLLGMIRLSKANIDSMLTKLAENAYLTD